MWVTEVRSQSQFCRCLEENKGTEHEENYPAHILALIWLVMVAGCFLFWIALLRFLLSGL